VNATTDIAVVGGGTGGTLAANLLAKHLRPEIRSGKVRVFLISGAKTHIFQPGYLHIAFKNQNAAAITHKQETLVGKDVTWIREDADGLDLKARAINLRSGKVLKYDYVVIATGSVPNTDAIPGLRQASLNFHTSPDESRKIWDALEEFRGGHVVTGIAGVPHKCPPSPNEGTFLLDDYFRKRGIRDRVKITFVTPYPRPYPAEPMSKVVEPRFRERNIEVATFFNVESVDAAKKEIYSFEGESLKYDLLIMVPPHRGSDVIKKSGIGDADGWIPTDKNSMKIIGYDNAYAVGDATDIPVSKTGVTAHLEATVAVDNIIASLRGEHILYKYNGRINCPFDMGGGKASFVIGSYDKPVKEIQPSRWRYALKEAFSSFYWRTLSGNWDWLLDMYFGETNKIERTQP